LSTVSVSVQSGWLRLSASKEHEVEGGSEGFEGAETASRAPYDEQAKTIDGPALSLKDADRLCAFARFCG